MFTAILSTGLFDDQALNGLLYMQAEKQIPRFLEGAAFQAADVDPYGSNIVGLLMQRALSHSKSLHRGLRRLAETPDLHISVNFTY